MSMDHVSICQHYINKIGAKTYMEIGVRDGECFFKIKAPRKLAIDPNFIIRRETKLDNFMDWINSEFYPITSDEFFELHSDKLKNGIDVVLIDGLHTHEQTLKDVNNCLKYLNPKGYIIMHDCSPASESMAGATPVDGPWNGDVWKTIVALRSRPDLLISVIDCDFGVGVISFGTPKDMVSIDTKTLTYKDLEQNRQYYLNLTKTLP
ncbi:hypothetical protein SPSIL_011930 [Sporomusa silvacetica DSM 10669]|uniref:Class I SAM-dependent methyltransferase n=1 Tax=Sporomusa silvacetica DSM 10669 TaxID=1123289 RepID=A0ABZ3II26_9FIRM|nr:class I SAM-dependent methyltransferase [Sporomusa silvacetica]OZC22067.1 hypothetical protein SPSIL_07400 [Sporomusa silvacetica DSM 10669]